MATYGYVRISSVDQNEHRQLIAMRENKVPEENIFIDKKSGKDFERPEYKRMINTLRKGDLLYILSIDRLGRDYTGIQNQWRMLTHDIGVDICVIDMPVLDTRTYKDLLGTFISDLFLQVLSFAAENEKKNLKTRQKQGIKAAKSRGVIFGRPRKNLPDGFEMSVKLWKNGDVSLISILKKYDISSSTFYRRIKDYADINLH